jgi:hypothetical protein
MDAVFGGPPARDTGSSDEATASDARGPRGLAALARELRERERRALLEREGPLHETIRADTAGLRAELEELAVRALADGHTLVGLSAAAMPSSDARARFEAMGRLAATCARTAEVEEVLREEAHALGGEMPADRSAHLRRARSRARFELHSAVRGAVLRGVTPAAIIEITQAGGLDLEEGDLVLAFEVRTEH